MEQVVAVDALCERRTVAVQRHVVAALQAVVVAHVSVTLLLQDANHTHSVQLKYGSRNYAQKVCKLCVTILKIMRALFANYFCHFLPKTFLGFVLHIAEYRIDLFYVYRIDKIAS